MIEYFRIGAEGVGMIEYFGPGQFWVNPRAAGDQGRTIVDHRPGQVRWNAGMNPNRNTGTWQANEKFYEWTQRKHAKVFALYRALVAEENLPLAMVGAQNIL